MDDNHLVTTLRTLTEKSVLGFGMFGDLTVGNIMKCNPTYLVWLYFNRANINYHTSIIKVLMLEGHVIEKPGKSPSYWDDNCHIWGGIPTTKKRYGIGIVEICTKAELRNVNLGRAGNRWTEGK